MRTPKIFADNLKNGIITDTMLSECLFSVNKRAKNYRDKEREYRNLRRDKRWYNRYWYDKYDNEGQNREKKEYYYDLKEEMLSVLLPNCIHKETCKKRVRYYDYDAEYYEKSAGEVLYENRYYDKKSKNYVYFVDVLQTVKKYYLFYDLPGHSFHTPINDKELEKYKGLKIISIGTLETFGDDINDLVSMQFVKKIMDLTSREQEIPDFYKWRDELRIARRIPVIRISKIYA